MAKHLQKTACSGFAVTQVALLLITLSSAGCGTGTAPGPVASNSTESYFAPAIPGGPGDPTTFALDSSLMTFAQNAYAANMGEERYVYTSGSFTSLPAGMLSLSASYANGTTQQGTFYNPPQVGFAVRFANEGGFAELSGQPIVPFASNTNCPSYSSGQAFQFVTIPNAGDPTGVAYGSATLTTTGPAAAFSKITQLNLSGNATPTAPSTLSGACSTTFFGQTISVPTTETVVQPGSGPTPPPSATISISPDGFLIEDNGSSGNGTTPNSPFSTPFANLLGSGAGAVGLPVPGAALTTSSLVSTQYAGFLYSTGGFDPSHGNRAAVPPSSTLAAFGPANQPSACPNPPPAQTGTLIYGGEFKNNDPATYPQSNSDVCIALGAQDPQNNGRYPNAMVYFSAAFPRAQSNTGYANPSMSAYSFPAVAITGQIKSKNVILLIGLDTTGLHAVGSGITQDWGIYLLQSN
jgi:hypothetical protein